MYEMFIIDGHNLLHTISPTERDSEVISDVGLCRIIGRYLKRTAQRGEIVLDGTGPAEKRQGLNESETKQWLEVFGFEQ